MEAQLRILRLESWWLQDWSWLLDIICRGLIHRRAISIYFLFTFAIFGKFSYLFLALFEQILLQWILSVLLPFFTSIFFVFLIISISPLIIYGLFITSLLFNKVIIESQGAFLIIILEESSLIKLRDHFDVSSMLNLAINFQVKLSVFMLNYLSYLNYCRTNKVISD